jgi:hypothetical protein
LKGITQSFAASPFKAAYCIGYISKNPNENYSMLPVRRMLHPLPGVPVEVLIFQNNKKK